MPGTIMALPRTTTENPRIFFSSLSLPQAMQ
jgi:hypothetical protein